jgi:hypothetical protein
VGEEEDLEGKRDGFKENKLRRLNFILLFLVQTLGKVLSSFLLVLFMLINVMTLDSCLFWSFMFVVDVTENNKVLSVHC